ncbi:MAG: T9SS type A sorting domain-containing protein, partial [Ignavibacteriaceae bacterium]
GVMTSISENKLTIPSGTKLKQNYPNPFNPTTNIEYSITRSGYVTIKVFNILCKLVSTLVQEEKQPGNYKVQFNGAAFPSGVYFYRMQAGNYTETKKFILLK